MEIDRNMSHMICSNVVEHARAQRSIVYKQNGVTYHFCQTRKQSGWMKITHLLEGIIQEFPEIGQAFD